MKRFGLMVIKLITAAYLLAFLCSNAAQPGVWNAGGGGFNFLYPADSSAVGKIRMQSERITIQLYPGFAVVKGTYHLLNTSPDTMTIRVGYPVNGTYEGRSMQLNQISFTELNALKVIQDGEARPIIEEPVSEPQAGVDTYENDNWYIWTSTFLPNQPSELNVYFMVNTNDAMILEGYRRDRHNAFIYILESGRIWQHPIEKAEFRIQLLEGLNIKDIYGISPSIDFAVDPKRGVLFGLKENFTPMPEDNLLVNYGKEVAGFDYGVQVSQSEKYFQAIDRLDALEMDPAGLSPYDEKDPYEVHAVNAVGWIMGFIFIGGPILILLGLGFLIYKIMLKKRKK